MAHDEHNTRRILLDLGIGDFNATMIMPYMFMGPAQTDPAMAQIQLITKAMQKVMIKMGATWLRPTGWLEEQTAHCFHALVGPNWNQVTWGELAADLNAAHASGKKFKRPSIKSQVSLGALDLPSPPDVPGGLITYAIGGYLVYRFLIKKGR